MNTFLKKKEKVHEKYLAEIHGGRKRKVSFTWDGKYFCWGRMNIRGQCFVIFINKSALRRIR